MTKKKFGLTVQLSGITQKDIGKAVYETRQMLGMTALALANKVNMSQAQISRLERGEQGFRSSTLQSIANALGVVFVVYFGDGLGVRNLLGKERTNG